MGFAPITFMDEYSQKAFEVKGLKVDREDEIREVFDLLEISEDEYPDYEGPETFAKTFKKFSLLKSHAIIESSSTSLD